MAGVYTTSMVDNVIICSNDPAKFVQAVRLYVERAAACGASLNDVDGEKVPISTTDAEILALGARLGAGPASFLGEEYVGATVRNQQRKVDKLVDAFVRFWTACEDPSMAVTRRQVASFIGLGTWMANTLGVHLCDHWEVLRLFSRLAQ